MLLRTWSIEVEEEEMGNIYCQSCTPPHPLNKQQLDYNNTKAVENGNGSTDCFLHIQAIISSRLELFSVGLVALIF